VATFESDKADTDILPSYPYFQNSAIENAANVFWKSVQDTRDAVNRVSPGKWVWVTETGWPVSGPNSGAAVSAHNSVRRHHELLLTFSPGRFRQERSNFLALRCLQGLQRGAHLLVCLPGLHREPQLWHLWLQRQCHLRSLRMLDEMKKKSTLIY
jgi:hypothetical protein